MESHYQKYENELTVKASLARVEAYLADQSAQLRLPKKSVVLADCIVERKEVQLDVIQLDDLESASRKLEDSLAKV